MRGVLVVCGALLLAPAASARQEPVSTQILRAGNYCTGNADAATPSLAITYCQQAITDLGNIVAANNLNGHESNLYWVMIAAAHATIGSKMGAVDGARTARVCGELETAWAAYSHVTPSKSPADYAADMETLKTNAAAPVRLCRSEFGAPDGGPPVPPG